MGAVFRCNRFGIRRNQLRRCAIFAGRRGGRLLLRRDLLHDALVPEPAPGHGHGGVLRLRRARRLDRCADLGNILALHGWLGLQGWQWIFLLEAAPALVLAAFGPFVLCDQPADARWLTHDEKEWLLGKLAAEQREAVGSSTGALQALRSPFVVLLTIAYLGIGFGVYANVFFLPLIIKDLGYSNIVVSYLAAVPAALGAIGMILVSRSSDRTGERVWHVTIPTLVAAWG